MLHLLAASGGAVDGFQAEQQEGGGEGSGCAAPAGGDSRRLKTCRVADSQSMHEFRITLAFEHIITHCNCVAYLVSGCGCAHAITCAIATLPPLQRSCCTSGHWSSGSCCSPPSQARIGCHPQQRTVRCASLQHGMPGATRSAWPMTGSNACHGSISSWCLVWLLRRLLVVHKLLKPSC